MSINRIDFGVMATSTDVTSIKAAEEARPYADQQNLQAQFRDEVETNQHSVNAKNDIDQGQLNSNAEDKGSNEYLGDGGRHRRGARDTEKKERQLSKEQMERIAEGMHDKKGKPIDFHLSSGFDLKI